MNLVRATFDPCEAQPAIANFDEVGRELLWRIMREALGDPNDPALRQLVNDVLAMPTVPKGWRDADLSVPSSPAVLLHFKAGPLELRFMTLMTVFQAPQSVRLDELRIETWYPADAATAEQCRALSPRT